MPNRTVSQFLQSIASNLESQMHSRSMSESALARASGVSPRTVGNFLRPSNRVTPAGTSMSCPSGTLSNLYKLAAALEVEPWELLHDSSARMEFHRAIERAYLEREQAELGRRPS
jgi:transcriptional regulator with XRE-family HTH domain